MVLKKLCLFTCQSNVLVIIDMRFNDNKFSDLIIQKIKLRQMCFLEIKLDSFFLRIKVGH